MFRFDWPAFVTPGVIARIAAETGVAEAVVQPLAPLIAAILDRAGGLPFVENEPSAAERTARGLALLAEAAAHTLADAGATRDATGYVIVAPKGAPYAHGILATPRVNMNSADRAELAALPGMTAAIVEDTLAERRARGRFANADDFEKRVDGIGPAKLALIRGALVFDAASDSRHVGLDPRGDLGGNLRALLAAQPGADRAAALTRALEMIATSCATTPHPATRDHAVRTPAIAAPAAGLDADWIGVLWSDDYYAGLPALLDGATQTIDVCMFHIALPSPTHPTFSLLEALKRAHDRHVAVRVLVDSDQKTDPYLSTVINASAKRFLLDAGIACRSDQTDRLLHSKYLILDRERVVLGSHNWSAGSYFGFDDLTLAMSSRPLASALGTRFEALWNTAS